MNFERKPIDTDQLIKELKAGKKFEELGVDIRDVLYHFHDEMNSFNKELKTIKKFLQEASVDNYRLKKKLNDGRLKALDVKRCAYACCYGEVYGVIQAIYTNPMEDDPKKQYEDQYFVNTPLCQKHYNEFFEPCKQVWNAEQEGTTTE
jgi:hypothetical protein